MEQEQHLVRTYRMTPAQFKQFVAINAASIGHTSYPAVVCPGDTVVMGDQARIEIVERPIGVAVYRQRIGADD